VSPDIPKIRLEVVMKYKIIFTSAAFILCASNAISAFAWGHNPSPPNSPNPAVFVEDTPAHPEHVAMTRDIGHTEAAHRHDVVIDSEYMKKLDYHQITIKVSDDLEVIRLNDGFVIRQK
jgi:hypothetical protein